MLREVAHLGKGRMQSELAVHFRGAPTPNPSRSKLHEMLPENGR
jgi:hypothetical protein